MWLSNYFSFVLKPAISFIKRKQEPEIFLAACLFLIIDMAIGMDKVGISKAMGAFLAGILLADSDIKKDIQNVMLPFKGMLMGVFFMALGMGLEFAFLLENVVQVCTICLAIFVIKSIVLLGIGRIRNGNYESGIKLCLLLSQGSELGLILLGVALQFNILGPEINKLLITCTIITIFIAPLLAKITEKIATTIENNDSDSDKIIEVSNVIPLNNSSNESDKKAA